MWETPHKYTYYMRMGLGCCGDEWGWGGGGGADGQWGAGKGICGRGQRLKVPFFYFPASLRSFPGIFAWILEAPGLTTGPDWAPWVNIGVLGVTLGASRLHSGCAWELLACLWRSRGVTLGALGAQNGCCR